MVIVRKARESDLREAARIYDDVRRSVHWVREETKSSSSFSAVVEGEDIFVALNESDVVTGVLSVWKPESFIHHLYVHSAHRRQGIGTALLSSLSSWLPRPWTLKCVESNEVALSFYRTGGWQQTGRGVGEDGPYVVLEF